MSSDIGTSLGHFITLVRGITYKGNLVGKPGPALLGLGSIHPGGGFRDADFKTYGGECPEKLMLVPRDLFASLKGATKDGKMIGSVARVPSSVLSGRLTQDTVKLCFSKRDTKLENYIYWLLQTPQYREYCAGRATGSAVVALSRNDFLSYQVPPLSPAKEHVVEILESIEKRLALLRETNATLEAIAQALFKSWFVDFDPVRAKLEGRAPEGMNEATAALFPDGFEESELELVPKGWQSTNLARLSRDYDGSIQTGPFGSQLHASDYVETGTPVVMPKDIKNRRATTDSVARIGAADVQRLSRHKVLAGDIVFSRRGDVEKHALITKHEVGWICGTGCLLLRPGKSWPSSTFLSMTLDAPKARTWLVQHAVGATMPNINTGILGSVPLILPPDVLLKEFENVISVSEELRSQNSSTAETLATLRDTLLPRLISGQLRLLDAEALEEAFA